MVLNEKKKNIKTKERKNLPCRKNLGLNKKNILIIIESILFYSR